MKVCFISDLHLFAWRSFAPQLETAIRKAVCRSDAFVFGGDIFDFHWSRFEGHDESIAESIRWLESLMAINESCQFHYLLGNHDAHPQFVVALESLAGRRSNFDWQPHVLRIEDCVFLHGDIVDTPVPHGEDPHEILDARRLAGEMRPRPQHVWHVLYEAMVFLRLHWFIMQLIRRKSTTLRDIRIYLDYAGYKSDSGISKVCFGHTHYPMENVQFENWTFNNPGAAIKGLKFRIVELGFDTEVAGRAPDSFSQTGQ